MNDVGDLYRDLEDNFYLVIKVEDLGRLSWYSVFQLKTGRVKSLPTLQYLYFVTNWHSFQEQYEQD